AYALVAGKRFEGWHVLFLTTTIATSVSGFLLPAQGLTPGRVIGALSLVVLAIAVAARYSAHQNLIKQVAYIATALLAQYFNTFVLVVQSFQKIPVLKALAPTQTEPAFVASQLGLLALFVALAGLSLWRLRRERASRPALSPSPVS
ncbi:MAG TPA: hypothetical protein VHB77_01585, partial [Planctomycetaceae bacterium]|nr:hypothetical protein [Planctomycetaceae bacterium]